MTHAVVALLRKLIFKGGIFQGVDGITVAATTAFHAYMKYLKLNELHEKKHLEEIEAATPMTHMRYIGHPNGAIYGFEQYMKDTMFFQPGRKSPIKGLYFASGWTGDCGFQSTLEAGKSAAGSILREFKA